MAALAGSDFSRLLISAKNVNQRSPNPLLPRKSWVCIRRYRVRSSMQLDVENSAATLINSDVFSPEQKFGFDAAYEVEMKQKGVRGLRRTNLVCTIGPACCSAEQLERLAAGGMNVARLNMCHNSREWHRSVIRAVKKLNRENGFRVSVMIDTEGSQVHMVDYGSGVSVKAEVYLSPSVILLLFQCMIILNFSGTWQSFVGFA